VVRRYLDEEYGNEGSRTHEYGARAKQAVQKARDQVAAVVSAKRDEVLFTSGATESNNLAILGLSEHGLAEGKTHVITSGIEHKAVLEPFEVLEKRGYEVTILGSGPSGRIDPAELEAALRPETMLVSLMHVNNETGIRQPLDEICEALKGHDAFLHTDAAQGFGKEIEPLRNRRIDLISVSGHKVYAPKGVGSLVVRRRGYSRVPITPLVYGGGQERNLRPGTLPVALVAGLGEAAELAVRERDSRTERVAEIRAAALKAFAPLAPAITGDTDHASEHVLNLSFGNLDSEALMVGLKDLVAISNGSACTSSAYTPSHVLEAMGMSEDEANRCVRLSWCHLTPDVDWQAVAERVQGLG